MGFDMNAPIQRESKMDRFNCGENLTPNTIWTQCQILASSLQLNAVKTLLPSIKSVLNSLRNILE